MGYSPWGRKESDTTVLAHKERLAPRPLTSPRPPDLSKATRPLTSPRPPDLSKAAPPPDLSKAAPPPDLSKATPPPDLSKAAGGHATSEPTQMRSVPGPDYSGT